MKFEQGFSKAPKKEKQPSLLNWQKHTIERMEQQGFVPIVLDDCFRIKPPTPLEFLYPDFYLDKEKAYIFLRNPMELTSRDIAHRAMLSGLYPEFKFVFLSRSDMMAIQQQRKMIKDYVSPDFSPKIDHPVEDIV